MRKSIVISSLLLPCGFAATLLVAQQPYQQIPPQASQPSSSAPDDVLSPSGSTGQDPNVLRTNLDRSRYETGRGRYETDRNRLQSSFSPYSSFPSSQFSTEQLSRANSQLIFRDQRTEKLTAVSSQDATEAEKEAGRAHLKEIGKAMETIKSTKSSDADKVLARRMIAEELDLKFELDLNDRRQQLQVIEKQLADLRDQLTARQESKAKLIELRIQLMENETKGLGFPSTWSNQSSLERRSERAINGWPVPATIDETRARD